MRFKKNPSLPSLGKQNFEEKETQNKTTAAGESFCFGYYSGDKKQIHVNCRKSFSLEKLHEKLPDFEGKQKLKVVRL
jgi:hypothetical protein